MSVACTRCGGRLGARNRSGLCRRCTLPALMADPAWLAARKSAHRDWRHANRRRADAQITQASRARLAWCPLEYRADYRRLTRLGGMRAADARAAIETMVARDAARFARTGVLQRTLCDRA